MAEAEQEKLRLLAEFRSSSDRFYWNWSVLSGGTLSLLLGFIYFANSINSSLLRAHKLLFIASIILIIFSLLLSSIRNRIYVSYIRDIAVDANIKNYTELISRFSEEGGCVRWVSFLSVSFYIIGVVFMSWVIVSIVFYSP